MRDTTVNESSNASLYFVSSDYYRLWTKEVRKKRTIREPSIPAKLNLGDFLLEIGVGEGRIMRHIFTIFKPRLYVGLDISSDILRLLKANRCIELVQADGRYLPFRDETFTCVLCIATSHYIPDKARLFSEVCRVLKERGIFLSDFKDFSKPRIMLEYVLRNLFNNLIRHKIFKQLLYCLMYYLINILVKVRLSRYGLDPEWLKSIFTYGATPYYPIRRGDCIGMLARAGLNARWIVDENNGFIILSTKK